MSIKYLQDQQLNQVQRSPNDSPWAKLVAQSELLERSRMRQPQGQVPQGTVAGDIQQQLMATQQQESERQNAELQKAQLLASLINSGHFAAGGLTQPVGTGAYRGILMSNPSVAGPAWSQQAPQATYIPPDSLDSAAQQKKHGMIQSLLDNSAIGMMQGKANIGDALQSYADLFSGKAFSRGFAEGGDIRGYAAGGETLAEQLQKIAPYISNTETGWTPEAIAKYESAYPQLKQFKDAAERRQAGQMLLEQIKTAPKQLPYPESRPSLLQRLTQTLGQVPEAMKQQNLASEEAARAARATQYQDVLSNWPQMEANKANAEALSGARSNLAGTLFNVAESKQPGEQAQMAENQARADKANRYQEDVINNWRQMEQDQRRENMAQQAQARTDEKYAQNKTTSRATGQPTGSFQNRWGAQNPRSEIGDVGSKHGIAGIKSGIGALSVPANLALLPTMDLPPEEHQRLAQEQATGGVKGELSYIGQRMSDDITKGNAKIGEALRGARGMYEENVAHPLRKLWYGPNVPNETAVDLSQTGEDVHVAPIPVSPFLGVDNKTPDLQSLTSKPIYTPNVATPSASTSGLASLSNAPTGQSTAPVAKEPNTPKKPVTSQNTEVHKAISNTNPEVGNGGNPPSVAPTVPQNIVAAAAAQQAAQAANKSASEEGQGSVLDSLYNKLKDSAVDYSELAKRISENEYDLARERKDGTFNAILGGIGAALSRAGTYEGVGDRVFKPGIGAIAGAGILGGLKLSEAAEDKYAQGHKENTNALLALQKLKGDSLNNVLDAISAQKQIDVAAQGARNTAAYQAGQLADKVAERAQNQPLKAAEIEELLARAAQYRANAQQATKDLSESEKSRRNTLSNQFEALLRARATAAANIQTTPEMLADYDKRLRVLDSALSDITGVNVGAAPTPSGLDTAEAWKAKGYSVKGTK